MRHNTSFDVLKLLEDLEKFLFGIPSRLPDTKQVVSNLIDRIDEVIGEE